jgi:type I restriction enzyme S subunit
VRAGDFLISKRQIVHDACGIVSPELDGAVVSNEYSVLTAREGCSVEFIHWFAQQPCVSASFLECSVGIVIEKMLFKLNLWLKREFLFPTLLEQQKIAACLSSLDELIAAQARKVEALKIHKKGLMQQLFPCEGESQPRVRFPEFGNDEQWGNVSLGEISEIKLGKMLDKQKNTTGYLLPYLNNISVRWNEVNVLDLPQMYFDDRELERFGLKSGDVVVCEGGEPGRAAVWDGHLPDLKFQKAIHRVRFNVPFEPKILVLLLESFSGTPQFEMLFTGGGIKHLTGETFSRLKIPLISLPEQKRIADCFTSLDELITAATQELDTLKTHKKGLMQQLFPAMDEMSA